MKHEFNPRHLNIAAFALAQGSLAGEDKLARFERLIEASQGLGSEAMVVYSARGELRSDAAGVDEPWIHLSAQTTVPLTCQRCLGVAELQVQFERDFRFVATEELAEVEDEESEEDVLVLSKTFDLLELIEDELLLASPLVPMHEACPEPVKLTAADDGFDAQPEERPNPFAVLQQLKKKDAG